MPKGETNEQGFKRTGQEFTWRGLLFKIKHQKNESDESCFIPQT
jgi:hypothetical protein